MATPHPLHTMLRIPPSCRLALLPPPRPQTRLYTLQTTPHTRSLSLPRILQPSFWSAMMPRPTKPNAWPSPSPSTSSSSKWNPAMSYMVLGLLVGSQAIHMLWLKQEQAQAKRRAEAKVGLLREVIERVQAGKEVDVERMLGTGKGAKEREWGDVLKELEDEEVLYQSRKRRKAVREAAAAADAAKGKEDAAEGREMEKVENEAGDGTAKIAVEIVDGVRFY